MTIGKVKDISLTTSMTDQYGETTKFDPQFHGPVKRRSCTDIVCLVIFFLFLVGWAVVGIIAVLSGDPSRLSYPTDSEGRVCGRDKEVKDKPFLLFFDLTRCATPKVLATGCPTPQVCIQKCPTQSWFYDPNTATGTDKSKLICKLNTDMSLPVADLVKKGVCTYYYIESEALGGRCFPKNVTAFAEPILNSYTGVFFSNLDTLDKFGMVSQAMQNIARFARFQQVAEGVVQDVRVGWWVLLVGFVLAMLVSFLWIVLLRVISAVMIWFSLAAFIGLAGAGAYYTMSQYLNVRNNQTQGLPESHRAFSEEFNKVADMETTWLVLFIITVIVFVICLLVIIFLRKRIQIAIALIGEASKAVSSILSTLFFPVIPYILHMIFIAYFCIVMLLLATAGRPHYHITCYGTGCSCLNDYNLQENDTCNMDTNSTISSLCHGASCQFFDYGVNENIPRLHIYNVFALCWTMFFVSAFGEMILAGTFASWYWALNKSKDVPTFPVIKSLGRTIRYHMGTLAFGSLIIAIIRFIRVMFEYVDHKVRKYADYKVVRCIMCCFKCCLWCLEKFLKFINRNAYVYCAIYGKNFCVSAKCAFSLLMRNIVRVFVLDKVTDFLLFIGKMVVVGGMGVASFFVFRGDLELLIGGQGSLRIPTLNYYLTPVIIITVGTFFIASAFFSVYSMAVDTLFLCFLEDCERNDGSVEKPYYMSKDLMKILQKRNKELNRSE